jgi:hypothetical protein
LLALTLTGRPNPFWFFRQQEQRPMMKRAVMCLAVIGVTGCGPVEVRIDETKGVPAVKGQTEVSLSSFTCGQPLTAGDKTVATKVVTGGC